MAGLKGYDARILAADGTPVVFTNDAMTNLGANTTYEITSTTKRYWTDTVAVIVQRDPGGGFVTVATTEYTVEHVGGRVVFLVAQNPAHAIRASGSYLATTTVAGGTEWTADIERNTVDDSEFGDAWEQPVTMMGKASGSLKLKWADKAWFTRLDAASKIVLILKINDTSSNRFETYALITKDSIAQNLTDLIREEISWTGKGRIYSR